jgi:hypothetical protein
LAMKQAISPSFTNWRRPKHDYSFWLKRVVKLPRKKKKHLPAKKITPEGSLSSPPSLFTIAKNHY